MKVMMWWTEAYMVGPTCTIHVTSDLLNVNCDKLNVLVWTYASYTYEYSLLFWGFLVSGLCYYKNQCGLLGPTHSNRSDHHCSISPPLRVCWIC